ncbi:MAG: NfeD family protein [Verrucomicrobiota bacterium]
MAQEKAEQPEVYVIPLKTEDISDARQLRKLEQLLKNAEEKEAVAIVYDLNVKGDVPWETQERLFEILGAVDVPTVAFVNPSATGTGALLALSSDSIYLSPTAIIGGAGIPLAGDDNEEKQKLKLAQQLSLLKARARSLAKSKGHNPQIAEAFIDQNTEVSVGSHEVSPKGEILTLTADEAFRKHEGKFVFGHGPADSVDAVLKEEEITASIERISPSEFVRALDRERISKVPDTDEKAAGSDLAEGEETGVFSRRGRASYKDKVVLIKIGERDLATGKTRFQFMEQTLKQAELTGAKAVVFEMDTPGGFAWRTEGLVHTLQKITVPNYTFVNNRAESAGSIIAVGTDAIYMAPSATIGSALVVSGGGADLPVAMNDKVTQQIIATVRNVAELNGHNPDVAEAFVTQDKEVIVDGVTIHEKGKVLNLNTIEATEEIGGQPVLAKGVASSVKDLLKTEGIAGEIVEAQPYGMEKFAHWIEKFAFVLIIIGIGAVYAEMNAPGFGLPGLIAMAAFGLFFFGNYAAGNLGGYELAVVFVLGVILIFVEIFIFPGTLIPSIVGGAMVLISLALSMVDRVDLEWKWKGLPTDMAWSGLFSQAIWTLALGLVGGLLLIFGLMRFFPQSRFGRWMVLDGAVPAGASIDGQIPHGAESGIERVDYSGWKGEATTDLRPAGKGKFQGKLLDIVADGEFIEKGASLVVIKHEGSRIVVERSE